MAVPAMSGKLETSERVDRHRVSFDPAHIAVREGGISLLEQGANAPAETGKVVDRNRSFDRERDRDLPGHGLHVSAPLDGGQGQISSTSGVVMEDQRRRLDRWP